MTSNDLKSIAQAMVEPGRGILAADESSPTIKKRFDSINVESTEENRRSYRELLFTTPGVEKFMSGVIMFDETLRQRAKDGTSFPDLLTSMGVVPGIKVDNGAKALAGYPGEKITEGLDGLRERLAEYRDLGAALARYAALSQEVGLVPIVEPEVLMDGNHTIERCEQVTEATLNHVFFQLASHRVALEEMVLKPNMVISAKDCPKQAGVEQVAEATVRCLRRSVPAAVPGIVFLSGGQSAVVATRHLNAMNALGDHPWQLSFSYGRALQEEALKAWSGKAANVGSAQKVFFHRAKCVGAARYGKYSDSMEKAA
jgi:fructose-bisphosphate aldolase class I